MLMPRPRHAPRGSTRSADLPPLLLRPVVLRPRGARRWSLGLAVAALGAVAAISGFAPGVRAQVSGDDGLGPTRGVFIPGRAVAGEADGTAVELNPGQLAQLTDTSLVVVGDHASSSAALPGRGVGLLLGTRLWSRSYGGLGLQGVGATDAAGLASRTKLQFGYALRLGRSFGLGVSWAHLFGAAYGGVDTFDAGASWRFGRYAALGVVAQDLGRPRDIPRAWTSELAIRPLGTDRLELAAAAVHVEGRPWRAVAPRFRLQARIADGLRPFAEVESLAGTPAGAAAGSGPHAFASGADYLVTAGLWIEFDHLGGGLAARTVRTGAAGGDAWGGSFLLRVSGDRNLPLVDTAHVERVSVAKVRSDRQFLTLVTQLRAMAADDSVVGVVVKIEDLELGVARIEELRDLLAVLRARGKKVFAYSVFPSTREMYLASACDRILVHPAGGLSMNGLSQQVTFYKEAMDHLGVEVDLVRIAEFKGAMEPFIMNRQSEPVRQNKTQLLDDVFNRLVTEIAGGRQHAGGGAAAQLSPEKLRTLIDRGLFTPREAEAEGLIDAVRDEWEVGAYVGQLLGRPGIDVRDRDPSPAHPPAWKNRRLAVVLVDGTIADAVGQDLPFDLGSVAGADTLIQALEQCRQDSSIAAVVLRVNSPGGSAFASDVIARAITRVRAAGKPVVVSMGDYAASGGYYIAAPGDVIFAEPSTITGSIGIFAFKADAQKLLANLGVSVETLRRGEHADFASPYRPWTDAEKTLIADKIRYFYNLFLATVESGRKSRGITAARADQLGRGQVWSGAQAMKLGLVDRPGGLSAAIDFAVSLTHLPPAGGTLPEMVVWPRPRSNLVQRLVGLGARAATVLVEEDAAIPATAGDVAPGLLLNTAARAAVLPLLRLLAPLLVEGGDGVQARLPFDLEIH
jgi:protease-4